jgi:hypothetical protein
VRCRASTLLVAAGVLVLSAACGHNGLSFYKDERVKIVAPRDRAEARLPLTVRWNVKNFAVTGPTSAASPDAGYFGVFVDQAPQPPGQTFRWFARSDYQCKVTPGCPDASYYASHHAYTTKDTQFVVTKLPELRPEQERKFRDFHEVIVVLLDGTGRRIGESAFQVDFQLKRT